MAFPLFRLPFELRETIYEKLFLSPREDKVVTPDFTRTRRRADPTTNDANNIDSAENTTESDTGVDDRTHLTYRTLNLKGLALLQTCKEVHEEATTILYGDDVFLFTDQPHWKNPARLAGFHPEGSSSAQVPCCDFLTAASFLAVIGPYDVGKLRHVELEFSGFRYLTYIGEGEGEVGNCGGIYVGEFLEYLSQKHHLKTLNLSLHPAPGKYMPYEWVVIELLCKLMRGCRVNKKLKLITGLEELGISPNVKSLAVSYELGPVFKRLLTTSLERFDVCKQQMEWDDATRENMLSRWTVRSRWWSNGPIDQVKAAALPTEGWITA